MQPPVAWRLCMSTLLVDNNKWCKSATLQNNGWTKFACKLKSERVFSVCYNSQFLFKNVCNWKIGTHCRVQNVWTWPTFSIDWSHLVSESPTRTFLHMEKQKLSGTPSTAVGSQPLLCSVKVRQLQYSVKGTFAATIVVNLGVKKLCLKKTVQEFCRENIVVHQNHHHKHKKKRSHV